MKKSSAVIFAMLYRTVTFGHFFSQIRALIKDCATSLPKRVPEKLTTALTTGHVPCAHGFSQTAFELPWIQTSIDKKKLSRLI